MIGNIHSVETCGTVDGPGIRFVAFLQGCAGRCQYCHNPDTWDRHCGKEKTVESLMAEVVKYRSFMKCSGGGITLSGGEPLMQPDFVRGIFKACRDEGIHTALDTSGFANWTVNKDIFDYTDLVLLDVKCIDPLIHHKLTGLGNDWVLKLVEYLAEINKPVWIRHVLVPGINDDPELIEEMATYLAQFKNIEKVEILPLHKLGEYKWEELGIDFPLKDNPIPTAKEIETVINIFKAKGLTIR